MEYPADDRQNLGTKEQRKQDKKRGQNTSGTVMAFFHGGFLRSADDAVIDPCRQRVDHAVDQRKGEQRARSAPDRERGVGQLEQREQKA